MSQAKIEATLKENSELNQIENAIRKLSDQKDSNIFSEEI